MEKGERKKMAGSERLTDKDKYHIANMLRTYCKAFGIEFAVMESELGLPKHVIQRDSATGEFHYDMITEDTLWLAVSKLNLEADRLVGRAYADIH